MNLPLEFSSLFSYVEGAYAEVEPWSFEQKLGEAVFIPTGCPYQVRNLKVQGQSGSSWPFAIVISFVASFVAFLYLLPVFFCSHAHKLR